MSICVFTKKGILYEREQKGSTLAIAVPLSEQKRQYADIQNPTASIIKDRYGILDGEILFRNEGSVVTVYGELPKDLYESREEVKVFLPEDLASLDVNSLYYIIGEHVIVHSV